jgi:hypothetical protein
MKDLVSRPHPPVCASDLLLDRLLAQELDGAELAGLNRHLEGCLGCAARLAHQEAFRAGFQVSPPLRRVAPSGTRSPGRRQRWPSAAVGALGALAAAAAALLIAPGLTGSGNQTRSKGGARLDFYLNSGGKVHRGTSGQVVPAGAQIQLVYTHPEPFWLAVISLDGAGQTSVYFPAGSNGQSTAQMKGGTNEPLPVSTILDDVLGTEQLFGLFCKDSTPIAPFRDTLARRRAEPPPPPGCRISRLVWVKRPR